MINTNIKFDDNHDNPNSISVIVEPLEKGLGRTIGNSLRRVLLSRIDGPAIIGCKFSCVKYEFCVIDNIYEDVQTIVANIASTTVKYTTEKKLNTSVRLHVDKQGEYRSSDIESSDDIEIVNKDVYLFTVTGEIEPFDIEICISHNTGYIPAYKHEKTSNADIYVDTLFSPVLNVNYFVETSRVGSLSEYDKLILSLTTNGTESPRNIVKKAAKILHDQFKNFLDDSDKQPLEEEKLDQAVDSYNPILDLPVEELDLSIRSENCIKQEGINYVGELVQKSESNMLSIPNLGKRSLDEIKEVLSKRGLSLDMYIDNWEPKKIGL